MKSHTKRGRAGIEIDNGYPVKVQLVSHPVGVCELK